jgi:hypothetical protein
MTRFHRVVGVLILSGAVGSGCSDAAERTVSPVLVDHDVQGSWARTPLFNPGNQFLMALTESAGVVTGTGTFAGEAAPGGALAISGSIRNDSLHLQVVFLFDPRFGLQPDTSSFDGVLSARDTINGMFEGGIVRTQLVRLRVSDPP